MIGLGTLVNVVAIISGTTLGIIGGKRLREKSRLLITDVLGCVVLLAAADALKSLWSSQYISNLPSGWTLLSVLIALLAGALIGSALNLEDRLEKMGERLKARFSHSDRKTFVQGFVAASLLFAIGPLAILGSISDGMGAGSQQLFLKSTLDFFTSIAFASTLGWSVGLSAIPVAAYQGFWTLIGFGLGDVMANYQVSAMTVTGGVLLLGIAFKMLGVKQIAVGNLLPALFIAPVIAFVAHTFL